MYTEEDLNDAIKQNIFNQSSVDNFRRLIATNKNINQVDEENFKLIGSFNDIFVVIACLLFLFSLGWALNSIQENSGYFAFSIASWGLSDFFVRKRKMSLPAIVLLIAFVGGIFTLCTNILPDTYGNIIAALMSTLGAYLHWLRFKVPITIAVGVASLIGFIVMLISDVFPLMDMSLILLFFGLVTFMLAMFWDYADIDRITYKSDVAFWLHLVSAPLIVHPIFSMLDILDGGENISSLITVIVLYIFMSIISITVDRRAFMVSSLFYVLYAITNIIDAYGSVSYSFALTGVLLGFTLLILSAYWHQVRSALLNLLPKSMSQYLA